MTAETAPLPALAQGFQQVLTFVLGEQPYGVDILRVQEIRGWNSVTPIPQAPHHVLGVLNLRGSIVPIVDLRKYFDLMQVEYNPLTVIIVLTVHSGNGCREIGVVVDAVSEVVDVEDGAVRPAPDLGAPSVTEHILGILPVSDLMIVLLDTDRLVAATLNATPGISSKPARATHA